MHGWRLGCGVDDEATEEDQERPPGAPGLMVKGERQRAAGQRHGRHLQGDVSSAWPCPVLSPQDAASQLEHAPPTAVRRDVLPPHHRLLVHPQPPHLQLPTGKIGCVEIISRLI